MPRRRAPPSPPSPPPPQTQTRGGGGIFSGVLSFVSREFESFVASATGTSPAAGDSRRNLDEDDEDVEEYSNDEDEDDDERRRRRRRRDRSPPRKRTRHARSHSRKRTPSPDIPPRKHRSSSRGHKRRRRRSPSTESDQDSRSSSSSSRVPSPEPTPAAPVPHARALKRRPSMTMPGSLFPRSPSMEPDFRPERDHRVRFTASTHRPSPSPSPAPLPPDSSCQSSDAPLPESVPLRESSSSGSPSTPRRTRTNVQSQADRFYVGAEDAGPSILLPSPHTSPRAYAATRSAGADKGKARALDEIHEGDTSGVLRVRGKEKELVAAREELDRQQRLLAEDHDDVEGEASFMRQVETDHDRDKARIRMLEEEIARLKQELSKRPTTTTSSSSDHPYPYPPPPPPPPPPFPLPRKTIITVSSASDDPNLFASARAALKQGPPPIENPIVPVRRTGIATLGLAPDKMAAFLNEMKTVRLRKTASAAPSAGRSVHDNGNATFVAPTPPSRVAQLAPRRSLEGLPQRRPLMDENAPMEPEEWAALRAQVRAGMDGAGSRSGEKRKRGGAASELAEDTRGGLAKRPSGTRTGAGAGTTSAHSSFASTSTSTSGSGSSAPRGLPRRTSTPLSSLSQPAQSRPQSQLQSQSEISHLSPPARSTMPSTTAWQTSSVTDAPTPSLCSDNENDNENYDEGERGADGWAAGRGAPDDEDVPITPPIGVGSGNGPSRSFFRFKGNGVPVEVADETMDKSMGLGRTMDRSMNRSMNVSMNKSLNRSINTSTRSLSDAANSTASQPRRATNASAPANARSKPTGIPRLKARPPSRSRDHSPPGAPATPPPQPQQQEDDEEEHGEQRPSTFIRARDTAPRANIPFLAGRAPSSPMPKSPRRPRAPIRVASRGSAAASGSGAGTGVGYGAPGHTPGVRRESDVAVERYDGGQMEEGGGHDQRPSLLLPAASLHERTPSPRGARRPPSRASASALSQSQSQPKQSKSKAKPNPKPTLKRRLTLDDELRSAIPFLHEDDDGEEDADVADAHVDPADAYMAEVAQQDADEVQDAPQQEEEDMDSGVLVGVGTRSKRRGFLAHGGAGGAPVFMGVGYVEGAEEDEALETGEYENGGGGEYADEAQDEDYEDAGGDEDDDEYLPSPDPRERQGRGQRRR